MQVDGAGTAQCGNKQPLAAEHHRFQIAGTLDIVIDAWREGRDAPGVDPQGLITQFALDDRTADVDKRAAIASQALQNEPFTAEEAGAKFAIESDIELRTLRCAEKGVFLANQFFTNRRHIDGDDFPGVGRGKSDAAFFTTRVGEVGHEYRFAR